MPVVVSNEALDPSDWTPAEQQQMYDELVVLLGISPAPDYAAMTDAELGSALNAVSAEIAARPAATSVGYNHVTLGTDTVMIPQGS